MNAVDTNVLVYARDPREPKKQAVAIELIESLTDAVLLWQVACEYVSVSKKLEPAGHSREHAWQDIRQLRSVWTAVLPDWNVADRAQDLMSRYCVAFWDAMIVAACLESGVKRLYSEDFSELQTIDGLMIVNPFARLREVAG
jgi:predicted nucleic acid-binding protein